MQSIKCGLSILQEIILEFPTSSSHEHELTKSINSVARRFDDITTKLTTDHPGLKLQDETEEPEIADKISQASSCATPTIPTGFLSPKRFSFSSDKNFALEFFKVELENFATFLSLHQKICDDKVRFAAVPEELKEAKFQLESYQVCSLNKKRTIVLL